MPKDNIIHFTGLTRLDLDPDIALKGAIGHLDLVVVSGVDKNGELYMASSVADIGQIILTLERHKMEMLRHAEEQEDNNG